MNQSNRKRKNNLQGRKPMRDKESAFDYEIEAFLSLCAILFCFILSRVKRYYVYPWIIFKNSFKNIIFMSKYCIYCTHKVTMYLDKNATPELRYRGLCKYPNRNCLHGEYT